MWSFLTSLVGLLGTAFSYYLTGQKNKQDMNQAYINYIESKKSLFSSSDEQYDSFERQKKRMEEMKKKPNESESED